MTELSRRETAFHLRTQGNTWKQVGQCLGITAEGARKLVKSFFAHEGKFNAPETISAVFPQIHLETRQKIKRRMRGQHE